MASALPNITTPLMPTASLQVYFDEISESLSQAKKAFNKVVRALESLDRLETTMNVPEEYENNLHSTFGAQATLLVEVDKGLYSLGGWLETLEGLMQRWVEDPTNVTSTMATTTTVVDEKRNQE